jgi:hypothetical protein
MRLVTPVIEGGGTLRYVASPLVTAMIKGGIAIIDEGNLMAAPAVTDSASHNLEPAHVALPALPVPFPLWQSNPFPRFPPRSGCPLPPHAP